MSENNNETLLNFRELSKVDYQIYQLIAEKNKLNEELTKKNSKLLNLHQEVDKINEDLAKKSRLSQTQEAYLKDEQQKLVARRKSIQTLNDYKLQEKANKEIDHANKQLQLQEASLLELMVSVDTLTSSKSKLEEDLGKLQASLDSLKISLDEAFSNIDVRMRELEAQREELSQKIIPKDLNLYKRVAVRYPGQVVVPLSGNSCTGCYFSISPQILVQVSRGIELVPCPNCGRILCLPEKES